MPWAATASARIQESVRPAIGRPSKASWMPSRSSNASDMARRPAPPVSTRVPSMSKRMSEARGAAAFRLAVGANVAGARSFGRRLFCEVDALAFIQLVEAALYRAAMKKPLLPAIVADEAEPSVANESLDGATRHPSLLERVRVRARGRDIKFRSTEVFNETRDFTPDQPTSATPGRGLFRSPGGSGEISIPEDPNFMWTGLLTVALFFGSTKNTRTLVALAAGFFACALTKTPNPTTITRSGSTSCVLIFICDL